MAMVINTNALSLNAQNNLNKSQQSLNTAIERLSSGSRINSAKDDAAGLAISNRMNAQVTGLNQANRNANDGISVAQTAEGALSQVTDNLQRVRELTVQAQNETLSQTDKTSIQEEIDQRMEEIDRLSQQTQFNGKQLLGNSKDATDFNNEMKIQVGANDRQTITLKLADVSKEALQLDNFNVDGSATTFKIADSGLDTSAKESLVSYQEGGETKYAIKTKGATEADDTYTAATINADGTLDKTDTTDVKAAATDADAKLKTINDGDKVKATGDSTTMDPLAKIDEALQYVDSARSQLGAQQNRLQSTIEGNATTSTNLSSAMSQIKDADYATEVSNMSKAQILQQAGTSVLAQANQTTQGVMSLLR